MAPFDEIGHNSQDIEKVVKYSVYFGLRRVSTLSEESSTFINSQIISQKNKVRFECKVPAGVDSGFFTNSTTGGVTIREKNNLGGINSVIYYKPETYFLLLNEISALKGNDVKVESSLLNQPMNFLKILNGFVHEYMHALRFESGPHQNGKYIDPHKDLIYSCTEYALPIYYDTIVFETFGFAGNCEACASATKKSFLSFQAYPFKLSHSKGVQAKTHKVCENAEFPFSQLVSDLKEIME